MKEEVPTAENEKEISLRAQARVRLIRGNVNCYSFSIPRCLSKQASLSLKQE